MTPLGNFSDYISNIINDLKNLMILGDINVHFEDKEELDYQAFNDLLYTLRLNQWVNWIKSGRHNHPDKWQFGSIRTRAGLEII